MVYHKTQTLNLIENDIVSQILILYVKPKALSVFCGFNCCFYPYDSINYRTPCYV